MANETANPFAVETTDNGSLAAVLKRPAYARRFEEVLGDRAAQFMSSLVSIGNSLGKEVEPLSIVGSAMTAACLDLPIDKNLGFAWIIPYRNGDRVVAQFQMGYKGIIQLGMRSAQYERMNATGINVEVFIGWDEFGEPLLDFTKFDPDLPIWGYFFGFRLTNGFVKRAVWSKEKVEKHAKRYSKAYQKGSDIWKNEFDAMALKTVLANTLRKWGPLSVQMQQAFQSDQAIIRDIDAVPEHVDITSEPSKPEPHPEKEKAKQAEQQQSSTVSSSTAEAPKEKKKKEKAETPPENVVKMPDKPADDIKTTSAESKAAETKSPAKSVDEAAEAAAGLAPAQQTTPPPAESANANVQGGAAPAGPSEEHATIQKLVTEAGYTLDDLKQWGAKTVFHGRTINTWADLPIDKVKFMITQINGVIKGLATARAKAK